MGSPIDTVKTIGDAVYVVMECGHEDYEGEVLGVFAKREAAVAFLTEHSPGVANVFDEEWLSVDREHTYRLTMHSLD